MEIAEINDHLTCFNYERSDKPTIEMVRIVKGSSTDSVKNCNEVIFVLEGRVTYTSSDASRYEGIKGNILFLSAGNSYYCKGKANSLLLVLRVFNPVELCKNTSLEKLFGNKTRRPDSEYKPKTKSFGKLEMNARIWHYLDGIRDCIADGIRCRCWLDMKVKEFFILLRIYYHKAEIYDFLFLILSSDTAFSEQVRLHWRRFKTAGELAEFMNYSPKQFNTRFTAVFGQTPHRWMMQGRATAVYQDIVGTDKQFKQIAFKNGFTSDSSFTRFCKLAFEKTPSQIREEKKSIDENVKRIEENDN